MSLMDAVRSKVLERSSRGTSPRGVKLPPSQYRMGGEHFQDNDAFVARAQEDVAKLVANGLTQSDPILDWGCGAGRLAVGLLETWPSFDHYLGIDIQADLIAWAKRNISRPGIEFTWVDVANSRYNSNGASRYHIPAPTGGYGALYGYSVLSHMTTVEVAAYAFEIRRILRPDGFAWVSAFIEDGVPDEEENPVGYGPVEWIGPLHCVRFDTTYFERMFAAAGLGMFVDVHGGETDGQTAIVLRPV